ncbi:MAG TPA: hypothetical protein VFF73_08885 [Planctomycetota bacterium]|nr:hypothetical protein [Planctomycetota bacterium]
MSSTKSMSHNPGAVVDRINNLLEGFKKIPASEQFDVVGTLAGPAALTTELEGRKVVYTNHDQAEAAAKNAKTARDAAEPETVSRIDAIEGSIRTHYGEEAPELTYFGLKPRKARRKQTPEEHAATVAKARATRAAKKAAKAPTPPVK